MRSNDGADESHRTPVACAKWASNLGAKRFAYAAAVDATDAAANSHADRTADAAPVDPAFILAITATDAHPLDSPNADTESSTDPSTEPRAFRASHALSHIAPLARADPSAIHEPHPSAFPVTVPSANRAPNHCTVVGALASAHAIAESRTHIKSDASPVAEPDATAESATHYPTITAALSYADAPAYAAAHAFADSNPDAPADARAQPASHFSTYASPDPLAHAPADATPDATTELPAYPRPDAAPI